MYLDVTGRADTDRIAEAADKTLLEVEKIQSGFDSLNHLTGFRPPSPEAAKPIKIAQGELEGVGLNRRTRVDKETSQVVGNAFERRSQDVGYSGVQAESIEEAERVLDEGDVSGLGSS